LFLSTVQPVGHKGFFSKEQINMLTMEQVEKIFAGERLLLPGKLPAENDRLLPIRFREFL
jgi:hypothetical protein